MRLPNDVATDAITLTIMRQVTEYARAQFATSMAPFAYHAASLLPPPASREKSCGNESRALRRYRRADWLLCVKRPAFATGRQDPTT